MNIVVCITEKEYCKAEKLFRNVSNFKCCPVVFDESSLSKVVTGNNAFAVIIGVEAYNDQLYSSLPKGGIIARFGVGHDGVDKQQATDNGIIVTNTPGVLDDSVAEHAIWLIGALARETTFHDANMKDKRWSPCNGAELKGKTLLVLGCGAIGKKVAKIASFGFGMNVIGYDIASLDAKKIETRFGISRITNNLDDVIGQADFISVHLPSLPDTHHFINKDVLSKMKPEAYLINTARGAVLDEKVLYEALKSKQIAGAALDVFETEPYTSANADKDLRMLDNIVLTPHVGSSTVKACQRMAESCLGNIKAAYEKKYDQLDILNPDVLERL